MDLKWETPPRCRSAVQGRLGSERDEGKPRSDLAFRERSSELIVDLIQGLLDPSHLLVGGGAELLGVGGCTGLQPR